MIDQDNNLLPGKKLRKQQSRGQIRVLGLCLSLCPDFLSFSCSFMIAFENFIFQNIVTNQMFQWQICLLEQNIFYFGRDFKQVIFYKKQRFYIISWSIRNTKNSTPDKEFKKMERLNQKLT